MACFHPITAYKSNHYKTESGKSLIVFNPQAIAGKPYDVVKFPCGNCVGCRVSKARTWALRCMHEASLYSSNCFITLTFAPEHLNHTGTLVKADFQKFMKRLRIKYQGVDLVVDEEGKETFPIRYYHCGEYGTKLRRPHHHACLFNFDFPDKEIWTVRDGVRLYRSRTLEALWPFGFCTIGEVTYQSAAYVARYIHKKMNGKMAEGHYQNVDPETGEVFQILPEYQSMSRRPGIGKRWFDQFKGDCFPKDFLTHDGKTFKIPEYYDRLYDAEQPDKMDEVKQRRKRDAIKYEKLVTPEMLRNKEQACKQKLSKKVRGIEQ